jgi:glycerol-3-phosphate O-acyltransferase
MESELTFRDKIADYLKRGLITPKVEESLLGFYNTYCEALKKHLLPLEKYEPIFDTYLDLVKQHLQKPFNFQPYHKKVCDPFDFYAFGVNFFKPLVDETNSTVVGKKNIQDVADHLKKKNNVIFFANHQIEADPQALSILLDDLYPEIASNMIFVAGERVTTDPLAVPFSMGRNLLCIYSKRYIDNPPEKKSRKTTPQ